MALRGPQPWNRDACARNHPLFYTDPDGRTEEELTFALYRVDTGWGARKSNREGTIREVKNVPKAIPGKDGTPTQESPNTIYACLSSYRPNTDARQGASFVRVRASAVAGVSHAFASNDIAAHASEALEAGEYPQHGRRSVLRTWIAAVGVLAVVGTLVTGIRNQAATIMDLDASTSDKIREIDALEAYQRAPCSLNPSVGLTFEKDVERNKDGRANIYWIDGKWEFECRFLEESQRSVLIFVPGDRPRP